MPFNRRLNLRNITGNLSLRRAPARFTSSLAGDEPPLLPLVLRQAHSYLNSDRRAGRQRHPHLSLPRLFAAAAFAAAVTRGSDLGLRLYRLRLSSTAAFVLTAFSAFSAAAFLCCAVAFPGLAFIRPGFSSFLNDSAISAAACFVTFLLGFLLSTLRHLQLLGFRHISGRPVTFAASTRLFLRRCDFRLPQLRRQPARLQPKLSCVDAAFSRRFLLLLSPEIRFGFRHLPPLSPPLLQPASALPSLA